MPPTKVCPSLYGNTPTTAILLSYVRLELRCCLELKPNGGQKGYHRMSTLRRSGAVRLCDFRPVGHEVYELNLCNLRRFRPGQAYFTFWKPAKLRKTENEHLFWLANFFSRSLHVLALEQIEIFSTSKLQT